MPKEKGDGGGGIILSLVVFFIVINNVFGKSSFGPPSYGARGFGLLVIVGCTYLLVKMPKDKKDFGMVIFFRIIYAFILLMMIAIV